MTEMLENGKASTIIESYSEFLFRHPGKIMIILVLVAGLFASQGSKVDTVEQQTEDLLPDSIKVIDTFNFLKAEFPESGGTNYVVLIETDPDHPNSDEIRDVRDPEFLRYIETITNDVRKLEKVSSVESPANLFSEMPSSKRDTGQVLNTVSEARWSNTISDDYTAVRITASSSGLDVDEQQKVANSIRESIEAQPTSSDLDISYTGQIYIDQAFQNQSQNTMNITSAVSLLVVMFFVIYLFRSVYYGLNSLLTVVFGIAVGFGIYGILGFNITPQTSGAISLGIGIAIDFGIQPISRYREEREELDIEKALEETFKGIITPMTLGLFAANLGFLALAVGKLTFLKDLGILLTLTTTVAFLSAYTVIPASMVLYDRYLHDRLPEINTKTLYTMVKPQ